MPGEGVGAVRLEVQGLVHAADQAFPGGALRAAAVRQGWIAHHLEPPGQLRAAASRQERRCLDGDTGVDEGGGDAFAEVLHLVGGFGPDAGAGVEQVDIVDQDESGCQIVQGGADDVGDPRLVHRLADGQVEEPGQFGDQHLRGCGGWHGQEDHG